jgi:hypothetical protein
LIQEIKDRVPVNVLSNDAIRYGIYDDKGNLIRHEYIKREDEPTEIGTPVNKALLGNIQGDLYTQDRYNKPEITLEPMGKGLLQGDIIPKEWERVSDLVYKADGVTLTASSINESTPITGNYKASYACDGDGSTQYRSYTSAYNREETMTWTFDTPQKITKMRLYMYIGVGNTLATQYSSLKIQGRNNNSSWTDLYSVPITSIWEYDETFALENTDYYKYYRIYAYTIENHLMVNSWEVVEYEGDTYDYVNNLSLPLTSYEVGKIVNIEGSEYYKEFEDINTSDIFPKTWTKNNDTKYTSGDGYILEASVLNNSSFPVYFACDGDESKAWQPATGTQWLKMTMPDSENIIKITKMKIKMDTAYLGEGKIQGSKDNVTWTDLHNITENLSTLTEINLENTDFYKYYRIYLTNLSTGTGVTPIFEWQVSEWIGAVYCTSFENPYLNINNLGAKQINGTIEKGEKYSLVYNGESWDFAKNTYVIGAYTGNGQASQFINLGFTPSAVLITNAIGETRASGYSYGGLALKDYPVYYAGNATLGDEVVKIVDNGFNVYFNEDKKIRANGTISSDNPYRYIAFN